MSACSYVQRKGSEPMADELTIGEKPEELPDEELLYDLADLFKVFSDTTRI